jgi:hypothetical protein
LTAFFSQENTFYLQRSFLILWTLSHPLQNNGKAIVKSIGESFPLQGISSEEILSFQKNQITRIPRI